MTPSRIGIATRFSRMISLRTGGGGGNCGRSAALDRDKNAASAITQREIVKSEAAKGVSLTESKALEFKGGLPHAC
jgi:hypothetical protein